MHFTRFCEVITQMETLIVQVAMYNLKLVGCGMAISLLITSWLSSYVMATNPCGGTTLQWNYLLSTAQVLAEQGDVFSKDFFKIPSLRLALAPFFLMSIILSDGYGNDNVYNLVLQRKLIPYERLEELVKDNVSILTCTSDVKLPYNRRSTGYAEGIMVHRIMQHIGKCLKISIYSEVDQIENAIKQVMLNSLLHPAAPAIWKETRSIIEKIRGELIKLKTFGAPSRNCGFNAKLEIRMVSD